MNQIKSLTNTSLLQQLPTPVALLDRSFRFVDASSSWLSKFQLERDEIIQKTVFEVFPSFSEDQTTKLQYALDGLKDIQMVYNTKSKTTDDPNYIWNLNPWKDCYGNSLGVALGIKDISEVSQLKMALQKAKTELNEKGAIAKIGSWEYLVDSDEMIFSPTLRKMLNLKKDAPFNIQRFVTLYKRGNSRNSIKEALKEAIESGLPWNKNVQMAPVENKEFWVTTIGRPKFTNGKCTRIIGTVQDISDKIDSKEIQRKENTVLQKDIFFEKSPTAMVAAEFKTGKIIAVNRALMRLTGYTRKQLLNRSCKEFILLPRTDSKLSPYNQLKEKGNFKAFELDYENNRSRKLRLRVTGSIVATVQGKKIMQCSFENITAEHERIKITDEKLRESTEHIEELVNFAHMVSHNLKAHATNFSLLFDFLKVESDHKERKKLISILQEGNIGFSETVLGLREIVAIRENKNLKKEQLTINESIYRTEQSLSGALRKNKVKLINEVPENLKVLAVRPYLDNILSNVLSNAIKFKKESKKSVIVIRAQKEKDYTLISIEDNGIGIDLEKNSEKLFKLYSTLGNYSDSRGMGLYLTEYQMKLMKGRIEVDSTLGEGSNFKLYFLNKNG